MVYVLVPMKFCGIFDKTDLEAWYTFKFQRCSAEILTRLYHISFIDVEKIDQREKICTCNPKMGHITFGPGQDTPLDPAECLWEVC